MKLTEKLIAIQAQLKAPKDKTNNFGGYKYRSCESILEAVKPLLQAQGWPPLIGVAIVYALGQLVESFLLTPYLVGERIGLHPLAVIFALMAFGQLFGFVGVLVALPVGAALLVGLREVREAWFASPVYLGTQPRPIIASEHERP